MNIVTALRKSWLPAVSAAVLVLVATVLFTMYAPRSYTVTTIVALVPDEESEPSGDLVRLAVPTYAQLASSPALITELANTYGEDSDELGSSVTAEVMPSTNTVVVTVDWDDPVRAVELANGVTEQLVEFSAEDPLLSAYIVAPAVVPKTHSFPPERATLVVGVPLAIGAAVAVVAIASVLRPWTRRAREGLQAAQDAQDAQADERTVHPLGEPRTSMLRPMLRRRGREDRAAADAPEPRDPDAAEETDHESGHR